MDETPAPAGSGDSDALAPLDAPDGPDSLDDLGDEPSEHDERSLLSAMMRSGHVAGEVGALLEAEHFKDPAHALIFLALMDLVHQDVDPHPPAVAKQLAATGDLLSVGGQPYLDLVAASDSNAGRAVRRAHRVRRSAVRRRLRQVTAHIDLALSSTAPVDDVIALAEREVLAATDSDRRLDAPVLGDILEETLDVVEAIGSRRGAHLLGVPTGFADLDALTGGLQDGHLIVIGGRPAMGTSTLGLDFLRACSIHHKMPAVLFTLQMNRREVAMRLMAAEARIPVHYIRSGNMDTDDWTRLARRVPDLSEAPLYIDESVTTLTEIRSKCRRMKRKHDIRLIVIDPAQLLDYGLRQFSSRYEEVNEISRHLKLMAKELQLPVVVVSTLNRSPEQRVDKRPQLHDLRDSGTLEDDADLVILLYRDDAYEKDSPRAGLAQLDVANHSHGNQARIEVAFQGHYSRFVDISRD